MNSNFPTVLARVERHLNNFCMKISPLPSGFETHLEAINQTYEEIGILILKDIKEVLSLIEKNELEDKEHHSITMEHYYNHYKSGLTPMGSAIMFQESSEFIDKLPTDHCFKHNREQIITHFQMVCFYLQISFDKALEIMQQKSLIHSTTYVHLKKLCLQLYIVKK